MVAKHYCNRRTARYTIVTILILSIFVNLPLFLYTNIRVYCTHNGSIKYYGLEASPLLRTKSFSRIFYPTMVSISLLIPWLICFLIWLFLIRALRSAQTQLPNKNRSSIGNDRKQDTYFRITLMIVCVLTVYMICRSAHLLEVIIVFIAPLFNLQQQRFFYHLRIKLFCISNIMLTINHGANFYIYSINPKFRLTLKLYLTYLVRRCRAKRRRVFTLFHLRRKKTNDSLDGLSTCHDVNRSMILGTPHLNGGPRLSAPLMINGSICQNSYHPRTSLRTPQKYLKQFLDVNSINENSEKSYVWREIEHRLKHSRRNYLR